MVSERLESSQMKRLISRSKAYGDPRNWNLGKQNSNEEAQLFGECSSLDLSKLYRSSLQFSSAVDLQRSTEIL